MGVQPLPGNKQPQSLGNSTSGQVPTSTGSVGGVTGGAGFGGKSQSATEQLVQMQDKLGDKERDPTQNLGYVSNSYTLYM